MSNAVPPHRASTRFPEQEMLLDFLQCNDVACPVCGYNLRALTQPICPECNQDLVLTVSAKRIRLGLLFVAIAPGFFSGIAACFLLLMTLAIYFEEGAFVPPFVGAVLFGWCSGLFAIVLAVRRTRFIGRSRLRQGCAALLIWLVHAGALVLFIIFTDPYIQ